MIDLIIIGLQFHQKPAYYDDFGAEIKPFSAFLFFCILLPGKARWYFGEISSPQASCKWAGIGQNVGFLFNYYLWLLICKANGHTPCTSTKSSTIFNYWGLIKIIDERQFNESLQPADLAITLVQAHHWYPLPVSSKSSTGILKDADLLVVLCFENYLWLNYLYLQYDWLCEFIH